MALFYSQNAEDVLLARCFEGQNNGFYVDVGAEDPVEGSITKHFYERGWRGINIEPVPAFFERIAADRPRDTNLQCVASDQDGQTLSLCIAAGTGLSTLDAGRQQVLQHRPDYAVDTIEVHSQRLTTILETHGQQRIDFLKIDVEGHELAVLRGLDLNTHHPRVIVIETTLPLMHPGGRVAMDARPTAAPDADAINQLVSAAGYLKVYFDGLNTWWIDRNEPGLAAAFQTPPNCFDTISPMETYRIIAQLTRRVEASEAAHQEALIQSQELQQRLLHNQAAQDALQQQQQTLSQALDQLQANHAALLNSMSWKLTKPLRWLVGRAKRGISSLRTSQSR